MLLIGRTREVWLVLLLLLECCGYGFLLKGFCFELGSFNNESARVIVRLRMCHLKIYFFIRIYF
jgi:hypothetical protein